MERITQEKAKPVVKQGRKATGQNNIRVAGNQLKKLDIYCEKTATAFFDAIMKTALQ